MSKINRNAPCPCGSGKKYKKCCEKKDQAPRRQRAILAGQFSSEEIDQETTDALAAYEKSFEEIEKLTETMDTHRVEFQKVLNNPQALADHVGTLLADERFAAYRYNADDVKQACEAAAYPQPPAKATTEYGQFLILTTGYLANKKRRLEIANDLLEMIPGYVKDEQFLNAWLLQFCAYHLAETPTEANLFLTEMLNYGLQEMEEAEAIQ